MNDYELEADQIIQWAVDYAEYQELEKVAKALYGIYVQRRKNDHSDEHKKNRKIRRQLTNTGEFKKPKLPKWQKRKIAAERALAQNSRKFL